MQLKVQLILLNSCHFFTCLEAQLLIFVVKDLQFRVIECCANLEKQSETFSVRGQTSSFDHNYSAGDALNLPLLRHCQC
jgi:hypothetical protein